MQMKNNYFRYEKFNETWKVNRSKGEIKILLKISADPLHLHCVYDYVALNHKWIRSWDVLAGHASFWVLKTNLYAFDSLMWKRWFHLLRIDYASNKMLIGSVHTLARKVSFILSESNRHRTHAPVSTVAFRFGTVCLRFFDAFHFRILIALSLTRHLVINYYGCGRFFIFSYNMLIC